MINQRRTKKVIIEEDLRDQILSGQILPEDDFPTLNELAVKYNICQRTAGVIIKKLAKNGLLDISPGRRTRLITPYAQLANPAFSKPIAIISPESELLAVSGWRNWLNVNLKKRLERSGYHTEYVKESSLGTAVLQDLYSGIIVAGEQLSLERWESVRKANIASVKLSFFRPYTSTVFIDYRSALDQLALFLALRGCRRVIMLASGEREAKHALNWFNDIGMIKTLQEYNVEEHGIHRFAITSQQESGWSRIRELSMTPKVKTAYLLSCPTYSEQLIDMLTKQKKQPGRDYELALLSRAPDEAGPDCYINVKWRKVLDKMLEILFRHQIAGKPQFGQVIHAEFKS
ncbi:MAG: GntR family transcriptional regulator [Victivallaceae bacterium]|nr:GntR family transcriptional regulator [Victivallaceae bacterium]